MINTSIVLYNHTIKEITPLIDILHQSKIVEKIYLIDNSPTRTVDFETLNVTYIFNNKNIGYGAAHNIALKKSIADKTPYHLVVNPDISFQPDILLKIEQFMNESQAIGHLMPKVLYPDGETQYLCKLIPTPFDLIFRRFLPKSWTQKQNDRFELKMSGYNKIMDVPYLSGCFMFLRTKALEDVGLFDERFFMYPEDIDLTRRMHVTYRTVFYPEVSIIHHHARSSYINYKMLIIHILNLIKYFNKWGWLFDTERKLVNANTLKSINSLQKQK
jgi:GT2 family glycosyltransferase